MGFQTQLDWTEKKQYMCNKLQQSVVWNEADLLIELNKVESAVEYMHVYAFACVQHMQIEN